MSDDMPSRGHRGFPESLSSGTIDVDGVMNLDVAVGSEYPPSQSLRQRDDDENEDDDKAEEKVLREGNGAIEEGSRRFDATNAADTADAANADLMMLLLLIAQWVKSHTIEQGTHGPLDLLTVDELLVVKGRVGSGESKAAMQNGVNVSRFEALSAKTMHVRQRVRVTTKEVLGREK